MKPWPSQRVRYRNSARFIPRIFDEEQIKRTFTGKSFFEGEQEGYVIRNTSSFHYEDFRYNLGKFVRPQHVQTSEHWLQEEIIPNKLKS